MLFCQFHGVAGRIKLKSTNFKEVSRLYIDFPYVKVALMLYGYCINESSQGSQKGKSEEKAGSSDANGISFVERSETYAKDLSAAALRELKAEVWFQEA